MPTVSKIRTCLIPKTVMFSCFAVLFNNKKKNTPYKKMWMILSGLSQFQKFSTFGIMFPGTPDKIKIIMDHKKTGQKFFNII